MNPEHTIYVKIETMTYKGKEVFYRKPINPELHKAVEYNNNYEYYLGSDESPKYLGKYIENRMYRSNAYFDDCNYPIIVFEKENVFENKKERIYCKGIPESNDKKMAIEGMTYEGFPVYYQSH